MSDLDAAAQQLFNQVHRLSPVDAWSNLPKAAKDVFRKQAELVQQDRAPEG